MIAEQTTPLWEVFIRARTGLAHKHVGSVHAADATLALQAARDVYTRRGEGLSIWVVPSNTIVASDPADKAMLFEPTASKIYRHPTFYDVPDEVDNM
jgi:ring-1,2-phenylacetyl-CoA epoxidase subunit PaaB